MGVMYILFGKNLNEKAMVFVINGLALPPLSHYLLSNTTELGLYLTWVLHKPLPLMLSLNSL